MKRYFIFFFFLSYLATSYSVLAQSVLDIAQEEVTQPLDISKAGNIILLNMGKNAIDPDKQAFYNAPNFEFLFRLKYNKATKDSWGEKWEATVRFKLIRIAGTYPANKGVLSTSEVDIVDFPAFNNLGEMELKIHQDNIEEDKIKDLSQVFVDYTVVGKKGIDNGVETRLPFDRSELHDTSVSSPFTTAIEIVSITVKKGDTDGDGFLDVISAEGVEGYIPVVNGSQDPIISFEVTPKPREVYGKVGDFVDTEELSCNTGLCYREEFEELVWKKIENAHFYDLEWVFIDSYDSKIITTATAAFAHRKGVRIRTSDRHYLVRLGTELTYPEGRIFFRIRGVGKQKPTEDSEVLVTTGQWNYGLKFLHLGADYRDDTPEQNLILPLDSPIRDNIFYKNNIHEENRNWQYATVFAEEGKYKKVMSYFDPSLRSTQTLTNFTTDASNTGEDVTLVEESFYDYEGRAVVQTIPAPLHTASLAHQSVNHERVNFFENNDKRKYDNLADPSPKLDDASLTASYYSANPAPAVNFSAVEKFKHQDFVPISNGFAYTQVRYTNDGTGRVKAQSGVGETFKMGGGKEVKTFYLNPSEEELRRLFGNELGDISHYKKVVTIDPNGQKSVAYIDQAGQTIATGLLGNSPEQLRVLEDANVPDFEENLIKNNQRKGTVSRTEHTFFVPETNNYTLDYSIIGTTTSLQAEGEELCLMCEYELEINIVDAQGKPINDFLGSSSTITTLPHITSISGKDIATDMDCTDPEEDDVNQGKITIELQGLTIGEYTITKELRLTAGDATQIKAFADALMTKNSDDFLTASELAAIEKAKKDCLECTEVIEEDGTVTQLATSNNCIPDPDGYTPADFHNLVTEQMKDQCEADQNRYVLDPNGDGNLSDEINLDADLEETELKTNYDKIPLCILCVNENQDPPYYNTEPINNKLTDQEKNIKRQLQNSYLYDSYMRGIKIRELDLPYRAIGMYIDRTGTEYPNTDFGQAIFRDPFWELFSDSETILIQARWVLLRTNNGESINDIIQNHINYDGDDVGSEPDLSEEEQKEQSWLIFQGFYQNFKRAHLKVFYQRMIADSESGRRKQCDPTAIDILLPELAGTNNINLAGLTLDNLAYTNPAIFGSQGEDDQWEQTWLGYTGTANCGDWAENMTVLLETKVGQCNGQWSLEEPIRNEIKALFNTYCQAQKEQPLANAFKKLYYSPYVQYDWMPAIPNTASALDYIQIYKGVVDNNNRTPQEKEELIIAFEVHFGKGALGYDLVNYPQYTQQYWTDNYGTAEKAELVRAYVESMIRAVSPTNNYAYHDYNEDGIYEDVDEYSEDVYAALEAIKSEIITLDAGCIGAFYAMLSVPDCKTHTYQEVEIPADNENNEVVAFNFFDETQNANSTVNNTVVIEGSSTIYDSEDPTTSYILEATIKPALPITNTDGKKYTVFASKKATQGDHASFEVGFVYRTTTNRYHIYQKLYVNVKGKNCNPFNPDITRDETSYVESTTTFTAEQVNACTQFVVADDPIPLIPSASNQGIGSMRVYLDGIEVAREVFPSIYRKACLGGIFGNGESISTYHADLFPLRIGSSFVEGTSDTPSFEGIIHEVRLWQRSANFNVQNVFAYKKKALPSIVIQAPYLLGYWKFNKLEDQGNMTSLVKDSSPNEIDAIHYHLNNQQRRLEQTTSTCLVSSGTTTKSLHTCQDAYTFGDGVDLWGGRPLTPPTAEELQADCERVTKDLLNDYAERLLVEQRKAIEAKIEEEYRNQCFESPFKEEMTLSYAKKEYHYTLYYYDQAGNLVQTVPPEGVGVLTTAQLESNALLELNSPEYKNPVHNLKTKYTYNTLGQVVWQQTPDAGESKFWIDYYGRVKLSQNAEQANHNDYAYSKFDDLGRPYEVGKVNTGTTSLTGQVAIEELTFDSNFPIAIQNATITTSSTGVMTNVDFTLSQRTKTFYDKQAITGIVNPNEQKNLKNRVAAVAVIETGETIGAITRYSYDIHGNVEKLWQKMPELSEKTVEYNYDLLSGKVNEVIYNRGGKNDEFRHRYLYDGDNRLTQVETSLDGYHWTREASYFYYAHGPLARIETGEHNLQGTDYFYTLQGWIKGVNSIGLNAQNDLAKDGAEQSTFSKDEYAYTLNYFEGDYKARAGNTRLGAAFLQNEVYATFTGYQDELGNSPYKRESLYNGNIAAMTTSIRKMEDLAQVQPITQSMNYRYDQLHRIAAAEASTWNGTAWQGTNGSYRTSYQYDRNGNIKQLYRNNAAGQRIDKISYEYIRDGQGRLTTHNRLLSTTDNDHADDPLSIGGLEKGKTYDYLYDDIGNLVKNTQDGIEKIHWNIYGKVEKVEKTDNTVIEYRYDGTGNRIMKKVTKGTTVQTNVYLRDAQGNVMAIYEHINPSNTSPIDNIAIKEIPIYGSDRLGQYRPFKAPTEGENTNKKTALGQRIYEFSNHLGNVLVTLTDNKVPQSDGTYKAIVLSASDYYPFGMVMKERTFENSEYRYGFNGKENDTDFGSHIQDYGFRLYSAAEARFLSVDPLTKGYPMLTPYQFASNSPIAMIDVDGLEGEEVISKKTVTIPKPSTAPKVEKELLANHNYTLGEVITRNGVDYQVTGIKPDAKTFYYFRGNDGSDRRLIDPSLQVEKIHHRVSLGDLDISDFRTLHQFAGGLIEKPTSTTKVIYDLQVYGISQDEIGFTELQPVIEATEIGTRTLEEIDAGNIEFEKGSSNLTSTSKDKLKEIASMVQSNQELHVHGASVMGSGKKPSDIVEGYKDENTYEELASYRATVAQNYIQIQLGRADIKMKKSSAPVKASDGGKRYSTFNVYNVHKHTEIVNPRKTGRYHNLKTVEELQKQN